MHEPFELLQNLDGLKAFKTLSLIQFLKHVLISNASANVYILFDHESVVLVVVKHVAFDTDFNCLEGIIRRQKYQGFAFVFVKWQERLLHIPNIYTILNLHMYTDIFIQDIARVFTCLDFNVVLALFLLNQISLYRKPYRYSMLHYKRTTDKNSFRFIILVTMYGLLLSRALLTKWSWSCNSRFSS